MSEKATNSELADYIASCKKLEHSHQTVCDGYQKLYELQKENRNTVVDLLKKESTIKELAKGDPESLKSLDAEMMAIRTIKTDILNSGGTFMELFLGKINSCVFIGQTERRLQFKQEYEDFKYYWTLMHVPLVIFIGFILPFFIVRQRIMDQLYQLIITYFYLTLAFRENILKVNGSNIHWWWINHHYFSLMITLVMLTWPLTQTYTLFRTRFYGYALYTSIIQIYQYKYQKRKLYIEKSLGKANLLDVPNSDSTPVHSEIQSSFMFLLPFIFLGHAIQFYSTYFLFQEYVRIYLETNSFPEWQILGVGIGFAIVAIGNFTTTVNVFLQKLRKPKTQ